MTWQTFLRTLTITVLGLAALAATSRVHAESGDASIILPSASAQDADAAAEASEPEAAEAEKPVKPSRNAESRKSRQVAVAKADSKSDAAETAKQDDDQVEQTGAIPLNQFEMPPRSRQGDAARAAALKPLIVRYASENGLPYGLADAVVRLESRYNPGARNGPNMGLTQINFRTAQSLGYQGTAAGLLDAETNLRYGLKYLAKAYQLAGGDTCGTILRYQSGHRTTTMTSASRAYCAKVKVITADAE
jgi:soluble lytic murein transglycosylase-like protein